MIDDSTDPNGATRRRRARRSVAVVAVAILGAAACGSGDDEAADDADWMCSAWYDAMSGGGSGDTPDAALDAWFESGAGEEFASAVRYHESARTDGNGGEIEVREPSRSDVVEVRDGSWGWTYAEGQRVEVQVSEAPEGWRAGPGFGFCTTDPP